MITATETERTGKDVQAAARGDRRAFSRLVERYRGSVCAVALGVTGDLATSEDVAQDVFVRAWRELATLREPRAFRAWLLESARNRARDVVRSRRSREVVAVSVLESAEDPQPSPLERLAGGEDALRIEASMAELSEPDREVLALYYREEQRLAEVAEQLGISEDAARQRLSRARHRLQADVERRLAEALVRTAPGASLLHRIGAALPIRASAPVVPVWVGAGGAVLALLGGAALVFYPGSNDDSGRSHALETAASSATPSMPHALLSDDVGSEDIRSNVPDEPLRPAPSPPQESTNDVADAAPTFAGEQRPADSGEASASAGALVSVTITTTLKGVPWTQKRIKMTPECGKGPLSDEEVLVQDGRLANVMVRVIEGAPPVEGKGTGVELAQEKCVYHPRISGIVAGQSIAVTSHDNFLHNVHTFRGDVSLFNKGQPAPSTFVKEPADFAVDGEVVRDGPITFKCDVHPWMVAHVVVNPNPYFAVTDAEGRATLLVPPGKYKIEAWHEKFGFQVVDLNVVDLDTTHAEAAFEFSAFRKPE